MTDPRLRLEIQGSEFVITMPGTSFQVTFRKLVDYPGISASHNMQDDRDGPVTLLQAKPPIFEHLLAACYLKTSDRA
jgi:hypothetical protein